MVFNQIVLNLLSFARYKNLYLEIYYFSGLPKFEGRIQS
ncbi:hypothetical protein DFQ03_0709 [Maribacter caenipelagi]|uniref:Uncharacterized protein n=1 Tax=Maribacter caenipelagi TaxID=1447781 RepID=A0A4R7DI73_9FLAO|nr:hypothetical protein DFQ03_0709 [Maribacter caenipelagi]